jgi:23S rRNA pseudouridine1911/1915/1917 synthase
MDPKEQLHLRIPPRSAAERLDRALARLLEGRESRSSVARLIRAGKVRVNGRAAKPSSEVAGGDAIDVEIAPRPAPDLPAQDLALRIVYEDDHLAVVDKPAGMSTHPAGGVRTGTVVNALLHRMQELSRVGGALRPGIVHRLDKGTSGLLVVAKDDETHRRLARAVAAREVHRVYEAVVWGRLAGRLSIDAPIGRHPRDRKRMAVSARGKAARTHVRAIRAEEAASHVEARLETGRTHQIRVHLAHRGHPVVGDATYGGRRRALAGASAEARRFADELADLVDRPALHARRLEFVHPVTGRPLALESPLPADMRRLVDRLAEGPRGEGGRTTLPPRAG